MWDAWGGDAGFSWSRKIVEREKNMKKTITTNDMAEEIKDILDDVVNPIDTVVEIDDDNEIKKALRAEVTREQMAAVIEHLMEAVEAMIEMPEEDDSETETETPEAPEMPGMPEMEDKMQGQTDIEIENRNGIYKSDNEDEDKWDNEMQKCWTGYKQVGMKEKNGRMVPNCVPVQKSIDPDYSNIEEVSKMESIWKGHFDPTSVKITGFNVK